VVFEGANDIGTSSRISIDDMEIKTFVQAGVHKLHDRAFLLVSWSGICGITYRLEPSFESICGHEDIGWKVIPDFLGKRAKKFGLVCGIRIAWQS